jgi:hypothetical protein
VNGRWAIAGISSANNGNGKGLCRYETTEIYARVSTAADWIEATMKALPNSTAEWTITAPFVSWPSTQAGAIAGALLPAFNSGDTAVMEKFNQAHRDAQALSRATPEARASSYLDLWRQVGKVTPLEYAVSPGGQFVALLRNDQGKYFQLSLYFFDPESKRFNGYWIGPAKPRNRG